jgi:SAM-dependent methyltransferase
MSEPSASPLYEVLREIATRPAPFSCSTIATLWTDPHLSAQMLRYHLDPEVDAASRRHGFIERSVAWLIDTFEVQAGRRVVDLGCGPGLYANRLARAGADVIGVDLSARSLDHAKASAADAGLDVTYVQGDYRCDPDLPAGPFDLALLIYCDYGAVGPDERRRLLDNVRSRLTPGGALVLDVHALPRLPTVAPGVSVTHAPTGGFWAPGPYIQVHSVFSYDDRALVLERHDIVEPDDHWTVFDWAQHFDPAVVAEELAAAGFRVDAVLGDVAGAAYVPDGETLAVVARPASCAEPGVSLADRDGAARSPGSGP